MRWTGVLILIPMIVLAAGVGQTVVGMAGEEPIKAMSWAALMLAGVAPVFAAGALSLLAPRFDIVLVGATAMLTSIGTSALFSLSVNADVEADFYRAVATRHALFVGAGFVAMIAGATLARRIEVVRSYPFSLLTVATGLIASTAIFGDVVNGARLWLQIGPARFQPSEVARLLLIGFIAAYLYERRFLVATPWRIGALDLPPAPYLLPLVGALLGGIGVLVFQNDLGMAALIALGAVAIVSGVLNSRSSLFLATAVIGCAAAAAYATAPRIRDRVLGWLDPWEDPMGRGFQFLQADFGTTAGGMLGTRGPHAALRVPEVHTDFVLIGISSQFGLLTAIAVLVLSAIVVLRSVMNATRSADGFGALLALSIASVYGIQLLLIAGGTLRVLPLTGLTFPLVSYGGTSLVVTLFSLGLIVGIGADANVSH